MLSSLILLCATTGAPVQEVEGAWRVVMPREGWWPAVCRGDLVLEHDEGEWSGTLQFRKVLGAARHELQGIKVGRSSVEFEVVSDEMTLSFEGRFKRGHLTGNCDWSNQRYSWTAARPQDVAFFEPELKPAGPFPRAEDLGPVDRETLRSLIREAEDTSSSTLVILQDGRLLCERTFGGRRRPIEAMSATKSIVSLAVGLAIDEEAIASLDQPVHELFEQWDDDEHRGITVNHLLTHTSGLAANRTTENIYASPDFVEFALAADVQDKPGTVFFYNNRATNLLPGLVEAAVGQPMVDYLDEFLFGPMGIETSTGRATRPATLTGWRGFRFTPSTWRRSVS